ncbi:CHRD domain-containing protein [Bacillus cereus]|uniref:CHRD domain-containing protein n=1 Tax=Bacillus cereus TaxID=1396 RepID=UPI00397FFF46
MFKNFFAKLTGCQEVPPVRTDAFGTTKFIFNENFTKLRYELVVNDLELFTMAHIHLGMKGKNGPIVAFLFGPVSPSISVDRGIVKGTLTKDDLVGPLKGMCLSELAFEMKTGNAYVNAHTERYPDGEIRGQIKESNCC